MDRGTSKVVKEIQTMHGENRVFSPCMMFLSYFHMPGIGAWPTILGAPLTELRTNASIYLEA